MLKYAPPPHGNGHFEVRLRQVHNLIVYPNASCTHIDISYIITDAKIRKRFDTCRTLTRLFINFCIRGLRDEFYDGRGKREEGRCDSYG